jgi:predicted transcriptional regulator
MSVLLSIKPKYVKEIFFGNKKYEFRKAIFKNEDIKEVYVYASSPEKKIVGKFNIGEIIADKPKKLWGKYEKWAGITKEEFFDYFSHKDLGFAIEIQDKQIFEKPFELKAILSGNHPPQSFCYLDRDAINRLEEYQTCR